ncbi:MAG: hypothetical protein RBJ76_25150 [Stenomitos frigidus ULC029]
MGLPFVLDIAIGLVFIYLILSLLASELQELLATLFQWRAKHLKEAIEIFLAGGSATPEEEKVKDLVSKLYDDPLLKNINQESKSLVAKGARRMTRWFIASNQKGAFGTNQSTGPSYIAPETFSTSLLERLGLSILAKKLMEVRLEKFAVRIVGSLDAEAIEAPISNFEKGRIRIIAEKANKDLTSDTNFVTLVEEYNDILHDFNTGETTLVTCVERMGESLDAYIDNYPLSPAQTSVLPVAVESLQASNFNPYRPETSQPDVYQPDVYQPDMYQPEAPLPDQAEIYVSETVLPEVPQPEEPVAETREDLLYFAKRLRAFKLSLFGEKNERAILTGGLRPSLSEFAQLVDETSSTYQEVFGAYESLLAQAEPLEAKVNPELEQQLLEAYPEAIEKEIVQAYPEIVEEQFLLVSPEVFQGVEKQLIDRRRKIYRANLNSQINLLKQQQRTLHTALGKLSGAQRQQILSAVLNQFGDEQRTVITAQSMEQLSNEQRYAVIALVFKKIGLTPADRSVYDNYQTYKAIQQVLGKLPSSIKESFAILARRAQSKVQQKGHELNQFREEISSWFDNSMSRASGVYKRNAKGVAILIGLVLASFTNSDAFFIVNRLSNDENLRKVITDRASGIYLNQSVTDSRIAPNGTAAPAVTNSLETLKQETDAALRDLSLPIGWKPENLARQFGCLPAAVNSNADPCRVFSNKPGAVNPATIAQLLVANPIDVLKLFLGWTASGLAIAMGAPFWFDLLGKVMNVRNSGGKPKTEAVKETAK